MENNVTSYLRDAVSVQNEKVIDFKKDKFWTISRENYYEGKIDMSICNSLFEEVEKKKKVSKNSENILIVAKTIKTIIRNSININNNIDELIGVYYVPAKLSSDGILSFRKEKSPWIPREFLAPMVDAQVCIGKRIDFDEALSKTIDKKNQMADWSKYREYCEEIYELATKSKFEDDNIDEKVYFDNKIYIIIDDTVNASIHIVELYNSIMDNNDKKTLYERFTSNTIESSIKLDKSKYDLMKEHCGQMGGEYPLSKSQREAVNHFNNIVNGEILAVNGPPGTGKTTLLQSIVANLFVERAINKDKPPVIVASSTNNQAVTNIIDSFGKINAVGIDNLEERWINGVNSFAVYFPSESKKNSAKSKGYHCENNRGTEFLQEVNSIDNIHKSVEVMKLQCSKYFNKNFHSINQCKSEIYKQLSSINKIKNEIIEKLGYIKAIINEDNIEEYIANCVNDIEKNKKKVTEIEEKIEKVVQENNRIRKRTKQWRERYNKLPWFIKTFSFISSFREKIYSDFKIYKEKEEYKLLPGNLLLDDILNIYANKIEENNKEISKYEDDIEVLNKKLKEEEEKKAKIINLREDYINKIELLKKYNIDFIKGSSVKEKEKIERYINLCDVDKINDLIDSKVRYVEFWLAVHYYECYWLESKDTITKNKDESAKVVAIKDIFYKLASITPCMVMTLFLLPKQFKVSRNNEKVSTYLYNFIDLLIIDEAGQVSPEVAACSFALAKKAIIVGDENQISPVWGVNRALDMSLAIENSVINNENEYETLVNTGLNSAQSSVMKVASNTCKYEKYNKKGLFLSEHRRCYDEIIEYCNELVYEGHLEPCRGLGADDKKYPLLPLPHMGYFDIKTQVSQRRGTSRVNYEEAKTIVKWIKDKYNWLKNSYSDTDEKQILGIITPFTAQKNLIDKYLKEEVRNISKYIDVGTVHTFQGAEKKVIIFSTVYGGAEGCSFIENNVSLMNVAVSRAKDSFLVFGARDCLNEKVKSSGLLKSMCKDISILDDEMIEKS